MCVYKRHPEKITSYLFNVQTRENKRRTQYEIALVRLCPALGSDGCFCVQSSNSATASRWMEKISNFSRSRTLQSKCWEMMALNKMTSAGIVLNQLHTSK